MWVLPLPHDRLGVRAVVGHEPVERVGHVAVAHVPRRAAAAHHRAVVALGAGRDRGVLLGVEPRLGIALAVPAVDRTNDVAQQLDDGVLTGDRHEAGGPGVLLRILAVGLEAAPRPQGGIDVVGLVLTEVVQDRAQRLPHAVDVQTIEADPVVGRAIAVVVAQPVSEPGDVGVGPHPRRPTVEGLQHLPWVLRGTGAVLDATVQPIAVRPVALDRYEGELLLDDQLTGDRRTPGVVLMRPVRGLADQDVARVADALDQWVEIREPLQRTSQTADVVNGHRCAPLARRGGGQASRRPTVAPAPARRALRTSGWRRGRFPAGARRPGASSPGGSSRWPSRHCRRRRATWAPGHRRLILVRRWVGLVVSQQPGERLRRVPPGDVRRVHRGQRDLRGFAS